MTRDEPVLLCGFECGLCPFKVTGAREYEMEWIASEHRSLIHGLNDDEEE